MEKILLLSSYLKEVIWGGPYFKDVLKITSNDKIGEMWSCSAHKNGLSYIKNGKFKDQPLDEVFKNNKELFNNSKLEQFPIIVKLIATSDKLSVQVHPDDDFALLYENQSGKTEGWLILDCKENSYIIAGHNAKNIDELITYVNNNDYDSLLNKVYVKKGDFYPIESGTIHAIGKDIVLLEIQQSSDVTYRFYDYDRVDQNGNKRLLHVDKAIKASKYITYNKDVINCFKNDVETIWDNKYFKVKHIEITGKTTINTHNNYCIVTVIEGELVVDDILVKMGDSFIITSLVDTINLLGNGKVTLTYSKI